MIHILITFIALTLPLTSFANVVGTDVQNFNPTSDGVGYISVHASKTLDPGILNLGWFFDYSKNMLPYFDNGKRNDSIRYLDFHAGLGIIKDWDIGINVPYVQGQTVNSSSQVTSVVDKGVSEIRLNTKYRFWNNEDSGLAVVASTNISRLEDDPYTGHNPGPTYNIELATDTMVEKLALAFNIGYRFRNPGDPVTQIPEIKPIKSQFIASLGGSYPLGESLHGIIEIFGSRPSSKYDGNTYLQLSSLEWIGALKYNPLTNLAVYGGGGTKLLTGSATPDWRLLVGMNWTLGPLWGGKTEEPQEVVVVPKEPVSTFLAEEESGEVTVDPQDFAQEPVKEKQTFRLHSLLFEFNSDKLQKVSYEFLDKFAEYLKRPPELKKLVIQGFTDSVGSDVYNKKLSLKRAQSVASYLIKKHQIPAARIQTQGLGKAHPIADNATDEGRDQNRRVEFKVTRYKEY